MQFIGDVINLGKYVSSKGFKYDAKGLSRVLTCIDVF